MELILVRHGDALSKAQDPQRPLSDRGRAGAQSAAEAAKGLELAPIAIFHSGKLRAAQTAEILAATLEPPDGSQELPDLLAPKADPVETRAFVFYR